MRQLISKTLFVLLLEASQAAAENSSFSFLLSPINFQQLEDARQFYLQPPLVVDDYVDKEMVEVLDNEPSPLSSTAIKGMLMVDNQWAAWTNETKIVSDKRPDPSMRVDRVVGTRKTPVLIIGEGAHSMRGEVGQWIESSGKITEKTAKILSQPQERK